MVKRALGTLIHRKTTRNIPSCAKPDPGLNPRNRKHMLMNKETLGHAESITYAAFPEYIESYTVENTCTYAVSFNGKTRFTVDLPVDMSREDVDAHVRGLDQIAKYVAGGNIMKVIVVPGKIVNIVVK